MYINTPSKKKKKSFLITKHYVKTFLFAKSQVDIEKSSDVTQHISRHSEFTESGVIKGVRALIEVSVGRERARGTSTDVLRGSVDFCFCLLLYFYGAKLIRTRSGDCAGIADNYLCAH